MNKKRNTEQMKLIFCTCALLALALTITKQIPGESIIRNTHTFMHLVPLTVSLLLTLGIILAGGVLITRKKEYVIALSFVNAGIVANLTEYIRTGGISDYWQQGAYVYNIADLYITLGICIFCIQSAARNHD